MTAVYPVLALLSADYAKRQYEDGNKIVAAIMAVNAVLFAVLTPLEFLK